MRATLVNASESLIEERRRLGIDKLDELWDGEWHLVNPPKRWHVTLNRDLFEVLAPVARHLGLEPYPDCFGIFGSERNWRVPDQAYVRLEDATEEGATSAELVVEIRSPGDESYVKLGFYAERGVAEVLIVHEDRRVELYRLRDDGVLVQVEGEGGTAHSAVLDVVFATIEGPRLRVTWADGTAEV